MSRKDIGRINRNKGHSAERHYASLLSKFFDATTARYSSRVHDDAGIDIHGTPFYIQVKAGYKRGLNYSKVLFDIYNKIELFLKEKVPSKPVLLIHRKDVGKGRKRTIFDDLVVMTYEDFEKILENCYERKK